jgi:iron complex transport system permease protein
MPFRLGLLFLASLVTATSVCVSGSIGFVGLVVPHMMRMIVGPDHRVLIPTSALAGAFLLVLCDTVGRMVVEPTEIRVGIMTALLGTPYFLYLLRRMQDR